MQRPELVTVIRRSLGPLLFAGSLLCMGLDLLVSLAMGDSTVLVLDMANSVVALGALAARNRYRVAASAVLAGVTLGVTLQSRGLGEVMIADGDYTIDRWIPPTLNALAVGALLGALALRSETTRRAVPLAVALGLATITQPTRFVTSWQELVILCLLLAIVVGIVFGAGGYLRYLDQQQEQAAETARREERLDLARELHDLVAHYVTGIVVQAQAAQVIGATRPELVHDSLAAIERAGSDALRSMRAMVGTLRADVSTDPTADVAALHDLVERTRSLGLPTTLRTTGIEALPSTLVASAHRIVRESLTNVLRHGREVTSVDVVVQVVGDDLEVLVRDHGAPPASTARSGGFGVVGMRERAEALGGRLEAGSHGMGWEVHAWLPVAPHGGNGTAPSPSGGAEGEARRAPAALPSPDAGS